MDLAPLQFVLAVLAGYFLVVFIVLGFIPGTTSQQVSEGE